MAGPATPPPLPATVLSRVLAIAQLDGWSIVVVAGLATLVAAMMADTPGATLGALILTAGGLELRGTRQLRNGYLGGLDLLVASQLMLLATIWLYIGTRFWLGFDELAAKVLTPQVLHWLTRLDVDSQLLMDLLVRTLPLTYGLIALATLAYQGGLARYYHRQRDPIRQALAATLRPPVA